MNTVHKEGRREPAGPARTTGVSVDLNAVPVWDDPNHYCRSCKRTYPTKSYYRKHIKNYHSRVLQESMQQSTSSTPSTL